MVLHDGVVVVGCVQVQRVHLVECVRQTCEKSKTNQVHLPEVIHICQGSDGIHRFIFITSNSWSTLGYLGGKLSWMLLSRAPTWLDVLPQHADVIVPVGATLFVVEAEGVEELVLDGAVVQAALTVQGQTLGVTLATHVGVAAAHRQRLECVIKMMKKKSRRKTW